MQAVTDINRNFSSISFFRFPRSTITNDGVNVIGVRNGFLTNLVSF